MIKKLLFLSCLLLIVLLLVIGSGRSKIKPESIREALRISGPNVGSTSLSQEIVNTKVVSEESVTIDVVKKVSPAVVTIGITATAQPFFDGPAREIKQDIGSGFIVKDNGLIITNRHVVSDPEAEYRIITSENKSYDVSKIYRDPTSDLAILKIEATNLPTVELGDSDKLQVGQFALAIGTALGEFRSTVTTGVVSGLSRGITAGSPFEGAEDLENVIQTSAPINPGNSGGPLLNSSGQVIGVNVAVARGAENIGFALPINLLKDSLKTFETNGAFAPKAFLGVSYRMVTRDLAVLNEIPEGAFVQEVVPESPAAQAGVVIGDIITKIDGTQIRENDGGLAKVIATKKPGQTVELTIYTNEEETRTAKVELTASES